LRNDMGIHIVDAECHLSLSFIQRVYDTRLEHGDAFIPHLLSLLHEFMTINDTCLPTDTPRRCVEDMDLCSKTSVRGSF
jgi:hypothetical protein